MGSNPKTACSEYKDTCIWCFGLDQSEDGLSGGFDAGEVLAMCDTNDADLPPKVTTSGDFAGLLNEQNEDPRWACNTSINTAIRSYLWQKECLNPKATIEDYFNANTDTDREEALSKLCDYCQSESDCPLIRMIRETGPFDRVDQGTCQRGKRSGALGHSMFILRYRQLRGPSRTIQDLYRDKIW